VTEGKRFEGGQLLTGVPAKAVRALREEERLALRASSAHYVEKARRMRESLRPSAAMA
jgi:carbonic anhydrase/acetyltransferase-like protein (isoleucine patch superfamily)